MDRREFLKSGAATIAALVLPKSKSVDTSELEKGLALWQEQAEFWQDETEWRREYAFRYSKTINDICEVLGLPTSASKDDVLERLSRIEACRSNQGQRIKELEAELAFYRSEIVAPAINWSADLVFDHVTIFGKPVGGNVIAEFDLGQDGQPV